jgi:hypothetical protein
VLAVPIQPLTPPVRAPTLAVEEGLTARIAIECDDEIGHQDE